MHAVNVVPILETRRCLDLGGGNIEGVLPSPIVPLDRRFNFDVRLPSTLEQYEIPRVADL